MSLSTFDLAIFRNSSWEFFHCPMKKIFQPVRKKKGVAWNNWMSSFLPEMSAFLMHKIQRTDVIDERYLEINRIRVHENTPSFRDSI